MVDCMNIDQIKTCVFAFIQKQLDVVIDITHYLFLIPTDYIKNAKFTKNIIFLQKMKTEDKNNMPKVRIAVIGKSNVGKSGKANNQKICCIFRVFKFMFHYTFF